ncbi:MAG: hypothetical protein SPI90_00905, partial [Fusobacterium mortiferum]|nr:hypothetical protein [Fusobacterium mortiferum]
TVNLPIISNASLIVGISNYLLRWYCFLLLLYAISRQKSTICCDRAIFFKEKASPIVFLLGIVAFFGVALTVGVSALENVSFFGCFLVFLSTIVVSFWVRLSKKNTKENELKLLYSIDYSIRNIVCFANNVIFS